MAVDDDSAADATDVAERGEVEEVLARIPSCASLSDAERRCLGRAGVVRDLEHGDVVIDPSSGGAWIVVLHGELEVVRALDGSRPIARLAAGSTLGEPTLLAAAARAVTVRAVRRSRVFLLDRACFDELASRRDPGALALALAVATELAQKSQAREDRLADVLARYDAMLEVVEKLLSPDVMRELLEKTGGSHAREDLARFRETLTDWNF
ncbi:MAG: cyclic nucleotide-binding domain-containing protein [Deltaproteobacteria bacterium]|nr:cyclic nucleotide-binding domain-containing protein [Deltaproteobacteria bacterium]